MILIFLLFAVIITFMIKIRRFQRSIRNDLIQNTKSLKKKSIKLKKLKIKLKEQPKKLSAAEMEHVMNEIKKISSLWKSRKERLRKGLWERFDKERTEKEFKVEDERMKLQREKERIEELIKKAKIKYRKREIDETSFRDIMKDYQKELMEITLKLSELKKEH